MPAGPSLPAPDASICRSYPWRSAGEMDSTITDSTVTSVKRGTLPRTRSAPVNRLDRLTASPETLSFRTATKAPGLSILIPVYNERATLRAVLDKVRAVAFPVRTEIVIVDDGSTDGSRDLLTDLPPWRDVRVIFHEANAGKGAAIQTALAHATGDVVVIQDADLELEPADLLPLFDVLQRGESQVCYGSRFLGDTRQFHGLSSYWANRTLNFICNRLNGIRISDMNTCYKMMRTDVARRLNLQSRGFAMEPEITTKLARMGVTIAERPVRYRPRSKHLGKKIRASAVFSYLAAMLKFRFQRGEQSILRNAEPRSTSQISLAR